MQRRAENKSNTVSPCSFIMLASSGLLFRIYASMYCLVPQQIVKVVAGLPGDLCDELASAQSILVNPDALWEVSAEELLADGWSDHTSLWMVYDMGSSLAVRLCGPLVDGRLDRPPGVAEGGVCRFLAVGPSDLSGSGACYDLPGMADGGVHTASMHGVSSVFGKMCWWPSQGCIFPEAGLGAFSMMVAMAGQRVWPFAVVLGLQLPGAFAMERALTPEQQRPTEEEVLNAIVLQCSRCHWSSADSTFRYCFRCQTQGCQQCIQSGVFDTFLCGICSRALASHAPYVVFEGCSDLSPTVAGPSQLPVVDVESVDAMTQQASTTLQSFADLSGQELHELRDSIREFLQAKQGFSTSADGGDEETPMPPPEDGGDETELAGDGGDESEPSEVPAKEQ
eukprot:TRINITY_DN33217_c0_g1_i1.p1 TRINITY_DN33217_c0_g1~~TRINITY_DN33217_c0_g1_i1.p1  ORF type:complete len:395 (-),score=43.63 TRINITY_DN33217_c0_g1_i1:1346-2530(-)